MRGARAGLYPAAALDGMSELRRRHFFTRTEHGYQINKSVRDLCVFVRHDLAHDPPFSRMDLVSCRNVLIYFDQELQKRVLSAFH
jgi:two-component system CheB/CheR fusion protein